MDAISVFTRFRISLKHGTKGDGKKSKNWNWNITWTIRTWAENHKNRHSFSWCGTVCVRGTLWSGFTSDRARWTLALNNGLLALIKAKRRNISGLFFRINSVSWSGIGQNSKWTVWSVSVKRPMVYWVHVWYFVYLNSKGWVLCKLYTSKTRSLSLSIQSK